MWTKHKAQAPLRRPFVMQNLRKHKTSREAVGMRKANVEYRPPTKLELKFLRIVTFGNPELECQVQSCEISEYDVSGWCEVNVFDGPPSPNHLVDGPAIDLTQLTHLSVNVITPDVPDTYSISANGQVLEFGPFIPTSVLFVDRVDIVLWTTDGMLHAVEVNSYGNGYIVDPYQLFVTVAESDPKRIQYPRQSNG